MREKRKTYDIQINAFFNALKHLQFAQAEAVLEQIAQQASTKPFYILWHAYLTGVLKQEKERDWAAAEMIFKQVLLQNPPDELRADIYLSLGIAYENQARWHESIHIAERGAALRQKLNQPVRRTMLLRQIAVASYRGFEAGDLNVDVLTIARARCEEAIATLETSFCNADDMGTYEFDRARYTAITYQVLGCVHTCLGEYAQASKSYQHFLEISCEREDSFHIGCASWYLADVLQMSDLGNPDRIITLYDDALAIFRQKQETFFQFHLLANKGALYRRLNMPTEARNCFRQSMALLEVIRAGISSADARSGFFSTVVDIHNNAILAQIAEGDTHTLLESVELARSRTFLDMLTESQAKSLKNSDVICSTSILQQKLPPDAIVIEFHCTGLLSHYGGRTTEQQAANNVLYPEPKILVVIVTQNTTVHCDLAMSPNMLLMGSSNQPIEQAFTAPTIRQTLYTKLIAPITHLLEGKRRIYIIPHGPLHYVPFHALIAPDGDTVLRDGGPEIVYAPSATIIFRELKRAKPYPTQDCLAVGYNGDESARLHFAEEEANYIADMADGTALVGPMSKKAELYRQAHDYWTLHFSCHGEFDPDSPLDSLLHIGPGETLTGQEIIDNLRLNGNLVTLSACESGLSKVQRGDELYGLIRAFMYAGAPAIIATLWRVDERSTLIFAEKFYQLLQQGVPHATAFNQAQLYLKNLTRKEALDILTRHLANTAVDDDPARLLSEADKYLKSVATTCTTDTEATAATDLLLSEHDDDKVFADPKFWAAFVLIGDPQI